MKILKSILIIFSLSLLFFFYGCKTTDSLEQKSIIPQTVEWEPLSPPVNGFSQISYKNSAEGITWHCIKIDLNTPNLDFISYPDSKDSLGKKHRVKKLAKKHNAVLAINTTPFELAEKIYLPVGIIQYKNQLISEPAPEYSALALTYDEKSTTLRAKIIPSQAEIQLPQNTQNSIFGGFYTILKDGEIQPFENNRRSRVGAGISDDGRFLYILVTTPIFHPKDLNGLSYEECARIFKSLGCDYAMQFDGGHSSALVVNGKDLEKPFLQRKVPTALLFILK